MIDLFIFSPQHFLTFPETHVQFTLLTLCFHPSTNVRPVTYQPSTPPLFSPSMSHLPRLNIESMSMLSITIQTEVFVVALTVFAKLCLAPYGRYTEGTCVYSAVYT